MLILYIAYLTNLIYSERRGFYKQLGIDIKPKDEYKPKKNGIKNHIKRKLLEVEKQGGD